MPIQNIQPATRIETQVDLRCLVDSLTNEPLIAVDTESNSLHAYQERVCLIQLSTHSEDYIVDPLSIGDMQPLGSLMASPNVQKVFHAAEYDIVCLKRDFGFTFQNLFDTMIAARICGLKAVGLGSLLKTYVGLKLDKRHQRDNWGKRPLSAESLHYAQMDTHYLPMLRDEFHKKLGTLGHLAEAEETFSGLCDLPPAAPREFDPNDFWNLGRPHFRKPRDMSILRELFILRDEIAKAENKPPFKILDNKTLIKITRAVPMTIQELEQIKGVSSRRSACSGKRILRAIGRGIAAEDLPGPPRRSSPDPEITERYAALHAWRKARAIQRGVESDIIISKHILWDVAQTVPETIDELRGVQGMGPWRVNTYGEEILRVLAENRTTEG
jgi:ribonuclease D